MIKKLISSILVCNFLILNVKAAVSVSDGSTFISKAEAYVDINSISNRLSNLENSIDSKIDSLVSSYLSRNGIWNGEKQTLASTTLISKSASSLTSVIYSSKEATLGSGTLVKSTTKSGLVSLVLTSKTGGQSINDAGRIARDAVQQDVNGSIFAFINTSNGIVSTIYLGLITTGNLGDPSTISTNWADNIASWFPMSSSVSFFVKKNDTITVTVKSFMNAPGMSNVFNANSSYSNGTLTLTTNSIYIY